MSRATKAVASLRAEAIRLLAAADWSNKDIAIVAGVSACYVSQIAKCKNLPMRAHERNDAIVAAFKSGETMEQIGQKFQITRERVRQILEKRGIASDVGGASRRAFVNGVDRWNLREDKKNKRCIKSYGCDYKTAMEINDGLPLSSSVSKLKFYKEQRRNANVRRIGWELTFPDWWRIWQESGHWEDRGRGSGKYCMSRTGDSGPYRIGNVEIVTNKQNIQDGYLVSTAKDRAALRALAPRRPSRDEFGFTPGERRVYDLMVGGVKTPREISERLGISSRTAANYAMNIRKAIKQIERGTTEASA